MTTIKIKTVVHTGFAACQHEDTVDTGIDVGEWAAMSDEDRNKVLDDYTQTMVSNHIDAFSEVVDG